MDNQHLNEWFSKREKLKSEHTAEKLFPQLIKGSIIALSKAITLIESKKENDKKEADFLLQKSLPYTGKSKRIGISGIPGVGKSSFIENLGLELIKKGHKVAVLAIDPSSEKNLGSILGDKTRMQLLSQNENSFIRPSPSNLSLGGVAKHTRECIYLCELAGFDIIIIETVGVGQSETQVKKMIDYFLLLHLPNSGDELQGIKRGIMEIADGIVVNKADGEMQKKAQLAKKMLENALHLFPKNDINWTVKVFCSSIYDISSYEKIIQNIEYYFLHLEKNNQLNEIRNLQDIYWFREYINEQILSYFTESTNAKEELKILEQKIYLKELPVYVASKEFLNKFKSKF
ncbi:MAG: methylmalonyl Co-A mutase-associated GTPase MeaB [Flavobacteriia bacterium]|nr:methylmalonyl Co-A mutase-associated GTPase MeaB [Flavobacteriia bacterium]